MGDSRRETVDGRQEGRERRRETGGETQEAGDRKFKAYFFRSLSPSQSKMDLLRNTNVFHSKKFSAYSLEAEFSKTVKP